MTRIQHNIMSQNGYWQTQAYTQWARNQQRRQRRIPCCTQRKYASMSKTHARHQNNRKRPWGCSRCRSMLNERTRNQHQPSYPLTPSRVKRGELITELPGVGWSGGGTWDPAFHPRQKRWGRGFKHWGVGIYIIQIVTSTNRWVEHAPT